MRAIVVTVWGIVATAAFGCGGPAMSTGTTGSGGHAATTGTTSSSASTGTSTSARAGWT